VNVARTALIFLVVLFGLSSLPAASNAQDAPVKRMVEIHTVPDGSRREEEAIRSAIAAPQTSSTPLIVAAPYYYGSFTTQTPCNNGHSHNYANGPDEATMSDAINDYEAAIADCFGHCTYTVTYSNPGQYLVATVTLGGGCSGTESIYGTANGQSGGGGVHDGGEGDVVSKDAGYVGDPINASTGNKFLAQTDYADTPWLTFRRIYNSSFTKETVFGYGWRHSFDRSIEVAGGGNSIVLYRPDGSTEAFTKAGAVWSGTASSIDVVTESDDTNGVPLSYTVFIGAKHHWETYSPAGLLLSVTDPSGQGITLAYSTSSTPATIAPKPGLLLTVTDSKGRQLSFVYSSTGLLSKVTLPDLTTLLYSYGANIGGNVLGTVTYPDAKTRQYLYNEPGFYQGAEGIPLLTGMMDESDNRIATTSYDGSYRAIASSIGGSVNALATQVTYNTDGTSVTTYPLGNTSTMGFTQTGGINQVTSLSQSCNPDCNYPSKSVTYDANGYPASRTDFNNNLTTTTYDSYGEIQTEVDGSGTSSQRTINTTWDTNLREPLLRTVLDENGTAVTKTAWTYNASGQVTALCQIDPAKAGSYACATTGTPPAGVRRTTYTYCTSVGTGCPLIGLLLTKTGARTDLTQTTQYAYYTASSATNCGTPGAACYQAGDLHTITDAIGHVTTIVSYDADGRVTRVTDANGVNTDSTYTPRGWLATRTVGDAATSFTYWPFGAINTITDPDGIVQTYSYDQAHRLIQVTDGAGNTITYTLDGSGNKLAEQITNNGTGNIVRSVSRTYNALGQLTSVVDGLGHTVFDATSANSYDLNGNLVQSSDAFGVQTQQTLDPLNRLVSSVGNYNGSDTSTQNTSSTFLYDALNRDVGVSDPNVLSTIYTFDGLGNRTAVLSPDTGSSSDTFDAAGNRLTHTDAKGIVATSTYDSLNRIASTSYVDTTQNVTYAYDEANFITGCTSSEPIGHLTRIIEDNVTTTYCYDGKGNVIQKAQLLGAANDITIYTYTSANRLKSIQTPDGALATYMYDSNGHISGISLVPPGSSTSVTIVSNVIWMPFGPVSSYNLGSGQTIVRTYDSNYRFTDVSDSAINLHFARDLMGNVVALGNSPGANPAIETYTYDPLYRLTSISDSGSTLESYTYNKSGDRLSKTSSGVATGSYSYKTNTHQLIATGNSSRVNDANGNTTGSTLAATTFGYGYNSRNRLVSLVRNGVSVATYGYNSLGQRIQKVASFPSSIAERYSYDERSHLAGEYGTTNRDYVWLGDTPVAVVDVTISGSGSVSTSIINYIHADGLDTPRAVTNTAGSVLWAWAFAGNPFGELQPTAANGYVLNLRYSGQYYDTESGTAYNMARNYDPTVGRYLQSDPLGLAAGPGTYAYVNGNPLYFRDANGQCPWCVGAAIGAIAGAVAGYEAGGWKGAFIGGAVGAAVGAVAPWASTAVGSVAANVTGSVLAGEVATSATFVGVNAAGATLGTMATNYVDGQPLTKDIGESAAIGAAAAFPEAVAVAAGAAEADAVLGASMSVLTGINGAFLTAGTFPISGSQLPDLPTLSPDSPAPPPPFFPALECQ